MKTRYCSKCQHFDELFMCKKGYQPRFYMPRYPMDPLWGWKRKCADFVAKEEKK